MVFYSACFFGSYYNRLIDGWRTSRQMIRVLGLCSTASECSYSETQNTGMNHNNNNTTRPYHTCAGMHPTCIPKAGDVRATNVAATKFSSPTQLTASKHSIANDVAGPQSLRWGLGTAALLRPAVIETTTSRRSEEELRNALEACYLRQAEQVLGLCLPGSGTMDPRRPREPRIFLHNCR